MSGDDPDYAPKIILCQLSVVPFLGSSCHLTKKWDLENISVVNGILARRKLNMIINHRLLSSPMIVNQWHSERINQLLVPTLRPSAFAPALGVD